MKRKMVLIIIVMILSATFVSAQTALPYVLKTSTGEIKGELLTPDAVTGKMPVVLLISGSGPTDMDGNNPQMKNNSLKMVAQALCHSGIASVRFDKRAIASSVLAGKSEEDLRFDDYVTDVKEWIDTLSKDIRFGSIFITGHSEGSLIGMIACYKNTKVKGFVSIAGAGQPADDIIKEQISGQPELVKEAINSILATLKSGNTTDNVPQMLFSLFRPSVQPYLISWFKYDPAVEIAKLTIPVMIIQGKTDIQVSILQADFLHKAQPKAVYALIDDMNHVMKTCASMDPREQMGAYSNPNLPVDVLMTDKLAEFINKNK